MESVVSGSVYSDELIHTDDGNVLTYNLDCRTAA